MTYRYGSAFLLCIAVGMGIFWVWTGSSIETTDEAALFRGVYHQVVDVPESEEGGGQAHLVRVDLKAEGIRPFVTPVDSSVVDQGAQYRLRFTQHVARQHGLAVAINGTWFQDFGRFPLPGRPARSVHTAISEGVVNHVYRHSYMIWGDSTNTPHIARTKPPSDSVLAQAQWGIGGTEVMLRDGAPRSGTGRSPNRRTVLAINSEESMLWLAVFESASFFQAAQILAEAGARDAIPLDGGGSTTLYIGSDAAGGRSGTMLGGYRPVATHVGIHADPLE